MALFEERRRQYEELAEKDDGQLVKDTVEMAELTGAWGCRWMGGWSCVDASPVTSHVCMCV